MASPERFVFSQTIEMVHRRFRQRLLDGRDEEIPVHHLVVPVQDVAAPGKIGEPHIMVEKSGRTASDILLVGYAHVPI